MRRVTIVVEVTDTNASADLASVIAGIVTTFDVGLETAGLSGVLTHYWCGVSCTDAEYDALAAKFDGVGARRMFDGDALGPDAVLVATGLARPARDV